jgi:hypothetical protein
MTVIAALMESSITDARVSNRFLTTRVLVNRNFNQGEQKMKGLVLALVFSAGYAGSATATESDYCARLVALVADATKGFPRKGEYDPPLPDLPEDPDSGRSYECGDESIGDKSGSCQISIGERDEDGRFDMWLTTWRMNDFESAKTQVTKLVDATNACGFGSSKQRDVSRDSSKHTSWTWSVTPPGARSPVIVRLKAGQRTGRIGTSNHISLSVDYYR